MPSSTSEDEADTGIASVGCRQKDVLIQRLKALRDREGSSSGYQEDEEDNREQSPSPGAAEESYELLDADPDRHQQRRTAQDGLHLSAVAEEAEPRPSTSTSSSARIQTDEFGALALSMGAWDIRCILCPSRARGC